MLRQELLFVEKLLVQINFYLSKAMISSILNPTHLKIVVGSLKLENYTKNTLKKDKKVMGPKIKIKLQINQKQTRGKKDPYKA